MFVCVPAVVISPPYSRPRSMSSKLNSQNVSWPRRMTPTPRVSDFNFVVEKMFAISVSSLKHLTLNITPTANCQNLKMLSSRLLTLDRDRSLQSSTLKMLHCWWQRSTLSVTMVGFCLWHSCVYSFDGFQRCSLASRLIALGSKKNEHQKSSLWKHARKIFKDIILLRKFVETSHWWIHFSCFHWNLTSPNGTS